MCRQRTTDARWRLLVCTACLGPAVAFAQPDDGPALLQSIEVPATIGSLRNARDALVNAADFSAALEPAERIVDTLETQGATGIADDVLWLAHVQAGLEDYDSAELNYLKAIDMLRREEGEASPDLIAANQALGRTYINTRRFAEAIAVLSEAQEISRRRDGLFNVEQSGLIDDLTVAHLGTGNTVEARELQLRRLDNALRRFGPDDARVIPFHNHLGDYYERSRLRVSAREQYARALELSDASFGTGARQSLELLRRLTSLDMALGETTSAARDRLATMLDSDPDLDPAERGLSLTVLGDWAIRSEPVETASGFYRQAYATLMNSDVDPVLFFAEPRMIDFVPPLTPVDRATRTRPWAWGTLVMEFGVSADGRVSDVETISMSPRVRSVETAYDQRLRETLFRPRLENGQVVATDDVRYTQNFRYYVRNGRSR